MREFGNLRLYTVEDLAERLGVHIDTVRDLLRRGKLKGKKLAKRWYVPEQALEAYFLSDAFESESESESRT